MFAITLPRRRFQSSTNFGRLYIVFRVIVQGLFLILNLFVRICPRHHWPFPQPKRQRAHRELQPFKVHFTTPRPSSRVPSRISILDEGCQDYCRNWHFRLSFLTVWQPSSRINFLDGTLDGGLDMVKCTF